MYVLIYYANEQVDTLNIYSSIAFFRKTLLLKSVIAIYVHKKERIIVPRFARMIHNRLRHDEIIISVRGSFVSPCVSVSHENLA